MGGCAGTRSSFVLVPSLLGGKHGSAGAVSFSYIGGGYLVVDDFARLTLGVVRVGSSEEVGS